MIVIAVLIVSSIILALLTLLIGDPISKDNVRVYPHLLLDVEPDLEYDQEQFYTAPVASQEGLRGAIDPLAYIDPPYAEELPLRRWQYRNVGLWSTEEIAAYCARYRQQLRWQHSRVLADIRKRKQNGT